MKLNAITAVAAAGLMLAGCAANSGPKENAGAVIGGVTGGLIGNTIGHGKGRAAATILGAALGAVVGAQVGRGLDEQDREYAYETANRSLRSNRVEYWENRQNGHRGQFKPRRTYEGDDGMCRDFEHTIWIDGEPEVIEGTACETASGEWRTIG